VFYSGTAMEMPDCFYRLHGKEFLWPVSVTDIGHSQNLWSLMPLLLTEENPFITQRVVIFLFLYTIQSFFQRKGERETYSVSIVKT